MEDDCIGGDWETKMKDDCIGGDWETKMKDDCIGGGWETVTRGRIKTSPAPQPPLPLPQIEAKTIKLSANHFRLGFTDGPIFHYRSKIRTRYNKTDERRIMEIFFSKLSEIAAESHFADVRYKKDEFFTSKSMKKVNFTVGISDKSQSYTIQIVLVEKLELSYLRKFLDGELTQVPSKILAAMELIMKDNPSRACFRSGSSFYPHGYLPEDINNVIARYRGFHQSLKTTKQGLALCFDSSVSTFKKPLNVIEFLKEKLHDFGGAEDVKSMRDAVNKALKGLKVNVTHRDTSQTYTIDCLTVDDACNCNFGVHDQQGNKSSEEVKRLDYFMEKYKIKIKYQNVPCLELGNNAESNKVPMELCKLAEGQGERWDPTKSDPPKPLERFKGIKEMVRDRKNGPCGLFSEEHGFKLDLDMTRVLGHILPPPELKMGGGSRAVLHDESKCEWDLSNSRFVNSKRIDYWVLLNFTKGSSECELLGDEFIEKLKNCYRSLGMNMSNPIMRVDTGMSELMSSYQLESRLKGIKNRVTGLQLILCVMTEIHQGYKLLKWISETIVGVVTQCCLSHKANEGKFETLSYLCLKINAKLGGSNCELQNGFSIFNERADRVMFLGADVSHPGSGNPLCPSIAAVVGTVNWPASNKYEARVRPQKRGCESIVDFGTMCKELIGRYNQNNKVKPSKIVVFRDGVSDGQFSMVLEKELASLREALDYEVKITVIVARKRHKTRLFTEDGDNLPPGTVVSECIVNLGLLNFYICSHYAYRGTSKAVHYFVLNDDSNFTPQELQKLTYDMCYTSARCTNPIALVTPVFYADLAATRGRMYQQSLMKKTNDTAALFDSKYYTMHKDVRQTMFFI